MPQVFVCHASSDKEALVRPLADALTSHGFFTPWYDTDRMGWGDRVPERIQNGILTSDYFIAVVTENALESGWVKRELEVATHAEIEEGRPRILLLVRADDEQQIKTLLAQIPLISQRHYLRWDGSPQRALEELEKQANQAASVERKRSPDLWGRALGERPADLASGGSDFSGIVLEATSVVECNLMHARFVGARLKDVSFAGTDLYGASFVDASVLWCTFTFAMDFRKDANKMNFEGADLRGTSFRGQLYECRFDRCDLRDAVFDGYVSDCTFEGAIFNEQTRWVHGLRPKGVIGPGATSRRATLSKRDLDSADLCGIDLSEASLADAWIYNAKLIESKLQGADLRGVNAFRANFTRADLRRACVRGGHLHSACLDGAELSFADFTDAELDGASFNGARYDATTRWPLGFDPDSAGAVRRAFVDLRGLDASTLTLGPEEVRLSVFDAATRWPPAVERVGALGPGVDLRGMNLSKASEALSAASLLGAWYDQQTRWPEGFDFRRVGALGPGSVLGAIDLSGQDLTGVSLVDANLEGARCERTVLRNADLSGAKLAGARFIEADLRSAALRKTVLEATRMEDAKLDDADLSGAVLRRAILKNASFARAVLEGADLRRADLTGAVLTEANLEGSQLQDAVLWAVVAVRARLCGAKLYDAELGGADFSGACASSGTFEGARHIMMATLDKLRSCPKCEG